MIDGENRLLGADFEFSRVQDAFAGVEPVLIQAGHHCSDRCGRWKLDRAACYTCETALVDAGQNAAGRHVLRCPQGHEDWVVDWPNPSDLG